MQQRVTNQLVEQADARAWRLVQQIAVVALIWAIALAAFGTILAATDSTGGCAGWPLCNGGTSPDSEPATILDFAHRAASLAFVVILGVIALVSYLRLRSATWLVRLSAGLFAIVLTHAVFGGLGVALSFPSWSTAIHLTIALVTIAGLVALVALLQAKSNAAESAGDTRHGGVAVIAIAAASLMLLTLAFQAGFSSDITKSLSVSSAGGAAGLIWLLIAFAVLASAALLVVIYRTPSITSTAQHLGITAVAALGLSALLALGGAALNISGELTAVPVMLAVLGYACFSGTAVVSNRDGVMQGLEVSPTAPDLDHIRTIARDLARVTKPAIMVLLLTTTLGAMLVAAAGWPGFGLVALTLLGGALASGGASALNCYVDRDIDPVMARTRKRPIPTGSLSPAVVLAFGLTLSALSLVVLVTFVNPLAATLALSGNLFYVTIYTLWLKRSTPQNIVIGGAAGSFPPLVGWAAVTGSLTLTPILIALIVFYWTPPHFWSLALLKANDYRRAGVPMMPVTHGQPHTRRLILRYSLLLLAVTLLLVPAGSVGPLYAISATILGAIFVAHAWKMYREDTNRLAWRLFKYSNYYLAAILLVMVLDAIIG